MPMKQLNLLINQQSNMTDIECLFQSFEGAGSIYVTSAKVLTGEQLKRHTARAIVHINGHKKSKGENINLSNLRQISITVEDTDCDLKPFFTNASYFISEARRYTNIMVWCPSNRQLAAVFVFAHMIIRYGYTIDYIWRLYDQRMTNISLSQRYIQKLRNLNKKQEEEAVKKLNQTRLGKRLLRIGKNYQEFGKKSQRDWTSDKKTKRQDQKEFNPEKTARTSRKGLSEPEPDYQECCQSEPSTRFRERSLTGSELNTHRSIFKSFQFEC